MIVKGGIDVVFENCYKCSYSRFVVDCSKFTGYIQPKVKYINCPDMDVDKIVDNSKVTMITGGMAKNNLRITIDDSYDFYLADGGYYKTVSDLKDCRQNVKICNNGDYDTTSISNNKTLKTKPYGYVEYVEITVPENNTYKLYVTDKNHYVDELSIKFGNSNKQDPNINMSVVVVKK